MRKKLTEQMSHSFHDSTDSANRIYRHAGYIFTLYIQGRGVKRDLISSGQIIM